MTTEDLPTRFKGWHTGDRRAGWRVSTRYFKDGAGLDPKEKWETMILGSPWDCVFRRSVTKEQAERCHNEAVSMCRHAGWRRAMRTFATALLRVATKPPPRWRT